MGGSGRLVAVLLALLWPALPAAAQETCAAPASLTVTARPMPHLAAALRPNGQVDVLALGSASLLGTRGGSAGSIPDRMIAALQAAVPNAHLRLTLRAGRAESAAEMLVSLRRELAVRPYQLVLWQTGTVEALRQEPPAQFRATLADGIAAATGQGADLVLIDMQFSRLLRRHAELQPYRAAMTEAALQPGVMLLPRFALMRAWAQDGTIDLEAAARADRRRTVQRLRECLGDVLARMLLQSAGQTQAVGQTQ